MADDSTELVFRRVTVSQRGIRKKPNWLSNDGFDLAWESITGWSPVDVILRSRRTESRSEEIVGEMIRLFGISETEAVSRINRQWGRLRFSGPDEVVYHEDAETWAKNIYYGHESAWWFDGQERERRGLPPLTPKRLHDRQPEGQRKED